MVLNAAGGQETVFYRRRILTSCPIAAINQKQQQAKEQDIKLQLPDALTFPVKYKPGVRPRNIWCEVSPIYLLASAGSAKLMASLTALAEFSPLNCGQRLTADLRRRLKTNHPHNLAERRRFSWLAGAQRRRATPPLTDGHTHVLSRKSHKQTHSDPPGLDGDSSVPFGSSP